MNRTDICIVIPIYNEYPANDEILSINRNTNVLADYDVFAVHPQGMSLDQYSSFRFTEFVSFDKRYFVSNKSYSRLILSNEFYEPFTDYEYMLIAQTDTYIVNTKYTLDYFAKMGYDYYGAPWTDGPFDRPYGLREYFKCLFVHDSSHLHVGNGGFSLRKIKSTQTLVNKHKYYIKYLWKFNEDLFFSMHGRKGRSYNSCPYDVASQFALETNTQEEINNGNIPYALHAWKKHLDQGLSSIHIEP